MAETLPVEGCYLLYESDSGGKLVLHYSREADPDAVGFWAPGEGKKIQGFKFNRASGKSELIKGIAGGDANRKKYFSGWCQFLKEAKKFNGSVIKFPDKGGVEVDLYGYCGTEHKMKPLDLDDGLVDISTLEAVACLPKHNSAYEGLKNCDRLLFMQKGSTFGAATDL
uniref:Immune mapped protein 2 N-terminal domain-containing protein n=1 Tax=Ditylum brightwellii TaxID=49249 RepID=A0A6S9HU23_9STRA|mmetsp:Transcript_15249/g.20184  ORF Transcript_15249/g.20184 Transcript_15249/m.20184 type:complete len:168 (-) Transcript_15249:90-593(-)